MALNLNFDLAALKKINWKRHLHTFSMVLMDMKVLGLFALSGLTIYGIGWDTVVRPSLEGLQSRDNAIKEQNDALDKKLQLQHEYGDLEQRLANLDTHMIALHQGTSAKIMSVTEAAELTDMALGKIRDANLPPLQPPHNARDHVDLKPGTNSTLDILHPNGDAPAATSSPSPAPVPSGGPSGGPPAGLMVGGGPAAGGDQQANSNAPMPAEQFNYDLSVTGTYPALMDLLNQLVTRKKLVRITKVIITKSAFEAADIPDAKDYPDYPLKLDMVVSLSLYLYADNNAPSP